MSMETFFTDTPWICLTYPVSDAEADANGGKSKVILDCCICGEVKEIEFSLPAATDPIWKRIDRQKGTPEAYFIRLGFQLEHMHEGRHANPMVQWVKPLRNPAAICGGIDLAQLRERITNEIDASNWPEDLGDISES